MPALKRDLEVIAEHWFALAEQLEWMEIQLPVPNAVATDYGLLHVRAR